MLVQRTDTRLAGIARNDLLDDLGSQHQLPLGNAVRRHLLGQQVVEADPHLLFENVARNVNHLHTVAQRRIDVADVVGRGDEKHFRKVVLRIEVVVVECRILFRIEHFEQCARRVAVIAYGHLVHLVEDDDRIGRPAAFDGLDDPARHRPDVGAAVTAYLGLVVQTAQRNTAELTSQRRRHGLAQRGLAYARRAVQTEDRGFQVAFQLDDGQMLQQTLFHFVQPEMVVVELLACAFQIEIILRHIVPGQLEHQLQIGNLHRIFGHGGIEPFELGDLLLEKFGHLLGPVLLGRLLAQSLQLAVGTFAQLVLNRAHLLLQVVIALLLVDLLLDTALDLVLQLDELLLAHQNLQQLAGTGQQTGRLQQRLAVFVRKLEVRTDEVDDSPLGVDILDGERRLLGHVRRNSDDTQRNVADRIHESLELQALYIGRRVAQRRHAGLEIRFRGDILLHLDFLQSV